MTELIKQRLVGMLIVVIAGVVFIPDLLDGQKQTSKSDFKRIPEQPNFDGRPMIKDFPSQQVDDMVAQVSVSDDVASDDMIGNGGVDDDSDINSGSSGNNVDNGNKTKGFQPQEELTVITSERNSVVQTELNVKEPKLVSPSEPSEMASLREQEELKTNTVMTTNSGDLSSEASSANAAPTSPGETSKATRYRKPLYILQLGSFKHKENVTTLREKLKGAGYETYIKPVKTKSAVLSKVYIGPESDRKKLKEAQLKARELTGLEGKITRFQPTN